jgi:subtilisin
VLVAFRSDDDALSAAADSDVARVSFGAPITLLGEGRPWGFNGSPQGHRFNQVTGTGVGVTFAIVDTGIDCNGPDFTYPFAPTFSICGRSYSFVPGYSAYADGWGHGTGVASIIAAQENGSGLRGAAPNAGVASYRIFDDGAHFPGDQTIQSDCNVAAAAIDQATYDLRDVINLSFGFEDTPANRVACQYMEIAVNFAYDAGLFVVAAAGNANGGPLTIPAAYDKAFAVSGLDCGPGAVSDGVQPCDHNATFWGGSSAGAKVAISAAAAFVATARLGGGVTYWNGTSQAAPFVGAAAALLIERYPEARRQAQSLGAHLRAYAYRPVGSTYDPYLYGAGILDVVAALQASPCSTQACILHRDPD